MPLATVIKIILLPKKRDKGSYKRCDNIDIGI